MPVTVHHGDSRDVLKSIPDATFDSVVCDPPYALVSIGKRFGADNAAPSRPGATGAYARASAGFMGQRWDTGETAFDPEFWVEVMRTMKPGAHLIAFSGTRTYHRLACAIEDAGFEIRDMVSWLYGSGFPKSHDVSKAIDRAAGAAREVVGQTIHPDGRHRNVVARDSGVHDGGQRQNGVGLPVTAPATPEAAEWQGWGTALKPACEPIVLARKPLAGTVAANVLAHGTGALNIDASRIDGESTARVNRAEMGYHGGNLAPEYRTGSDAGRFPANVIHDGSEEVLEAFLQTSSGARAAGDYRFLGGDVYRRAGAGPMPVLEGSSGSAARFFYSAKADSDDRLGSKHPTVKPIDLMAYLCRLVTRPGGLVLDPFAGSGSTGMACLREGFDCVLIEREAEYVEDIRRRIAHVQGADTPLFA